MNKGKSRRCGSCGHTWDPKGKNHTKCPNCNSTDLRFVIQKEPSSKKPTDGTPPPPVFGSWNDTPSFGRAPVPNFGAHGSSPGQRQSQATESTQGGKPGSVMALVVLCVIVLGVLGGLVLLRTGGKLPGFLTRTTPEVRPRPRSERRVPPSKACANILRRYRYAARMEKKAPRKWKKWRHHWAKRAQRQGCSLP